MVIDINNIIEKISATVATHQIGDEGEYSRWLWQNEEGNRDLGLNAYGCADAANILYTIGEFPEDPGVRSKWIKTLQNLQNPKSGLFFEETHHVIHTTAHCIAALELFDAKPKYPLYDLMNYATKESLYDLLENLPWETNPWDGSHQGAGIYAALVLSESVDCEWSDAYFDWMWENFDSKTGYVGKKWIDKCKAPIFYNLGSTFHYLFNHEYAKRPMRYPEKLIDTCIELYEKINFKNELAPTNIGFSIVDWIYCLTRASRQTPYRYDDIRTILTGFAEKHIEYLQSVDIKTNDKFNDLHGLFGCVCGLAELQQALPGMIRSKKPLKLVLDRRPFI